MDKTTPEEKMNTPRTPEFDRTKLWKIIWPVFTVLCPKCFGPTNGCSMCDGTGFVYLNNEFKEIHEKLVRFVEDTERTARMEAEREVERLKAQVYDFTACRHCDLGYDDADQCTCSVDKKGFVSKLQSKLSLAQKERDEALEELRKSGEALKRSDDADFEIWKSEALSSPLMKKVLEK